MLKKFIAAAGCIAVITSPAVAQYEPPAGYYNSAVGTGATLKASLNAIIDGHVGISYTNRETGVETLDQDPANPSNALTLYSGTSVPKSQFPSGSANTEHCWPNSYGIDGASPAYGDFFNLRVCDADVNNLRANRYYDDVGGSAPAHPEAPLCRTDSSRWEPRDVEKGDLARAMFYMDVRYEGDATDNFPRNLQLTDNVSLITGSGNYMGRLSTLVDWHFRDPVSLEEMQRNHKIYTGCGYGPGTFQNCQQNRNPFVDRPEFVWAIFGNGPNSSMLSIDGVPPVNGASTLVVEFPTVIRGAPLWTPQPLLLQKSGATPTTYEIETAGAATCSAVGTRHAFRSGAQSRAMTVGLNSTAAAGPCMGTIIVDNTDLTSAGVGQGGADGDDVITVQAAVLEHAQPSFDESAVQLQYSLDLGEVPLHEAAQVAAVEIWNLEPVAGYTADLRVTDVSGSGDMTLLTVNLAAGAQIAAGSSQSFEARLHADELGEFEAVYTIATADETLPGSIARANLVLTLSGRVVPSNQCHPIDANCDAAVSIDDVLPFVDLLLNDATPCAACSGDANGDGLLNAADIDAFVAGLLGG